MDALPGPTIVEIKHTNRRKLLARAIVQIRNTVQQSKAHSGLLIVSGKFSGIEIDRALNLGGATQVKPTLDVWAFSRLDELFKGYRVQLGWTGSSIDIVQALRTGELDSTAEKYSTLDTEDLLKSSRKHVSSLRSQYVTNGVVLFLGSGVSQSAKVPGWNKLLRRLREKMVTSLLSGKDITPETDDIDGISRWLTELQVSDPILCALEIRTALGDSFVEGLAEALYRDLGPNRVLLDALADFCTPTETGFPVKAIITYNFDNLLELKLEGKNIPHKVIHSDNQRFMRNQIPLVHVHGLVPYGESSFPRITPVFSEEGYHSLFQDPHHWANRKQENYLREETCIMIGLSLRDPNLRRLLRISNERSDGNPCHYALMRVKEPTVIIRSASEVDYEIAAVFMRTYRGVVESSFRELGLQIIWYKEHDEIPSLLRRISRGAR